MAKKVLFVASVIKHLHAFHRPYIAYLKEKGYQVEVAGKPREGVYVCETQHDIGFERQPFKFANISAYKKLKKIISDGDYSLIHCHTPVAAMMTRLASRKARKNGTRVIYTAHGFHFYKGAPLLNWLMYFPVEWICSFMTDILITINKEDYAFAKKHMHSKRIEYIPGVGVKVEKFKNVDVNREEKRNEFGIPKDCTAILSVGELNNNKNHELILRAIAKMERKDIVYAICGSGNKHEYLENLARELKMENRLFLLGYRTDLEEIYPCFDVFAFPSKREGLPVSVMEAMTAGLPCVVSNIRGNVDLIEDNKGGFLFDPASVDSAKEALEKLLNDSDRERFSRFNMEKVEMFTLDGVMPQMSEIYNAISF